MMNRFDSDFETQRRRFDRMFRFTFGAIVTVWVVGIVLLILAVVYLGDDVVRILEGLADKVAE